MKKLFISINIVALLLLTSCASKPADTSATDQTQNSGLVIEDEVVGDGAAAEVGSTIVVNYRGTLEDGTEFDSSYGREPATFPLGMDYLIAGWEQGIPGMKVGGKRKLIIPADLAYGDTGVPAIGIPGGATLYFEIELLEVK